MPLFQEPLLTTLSMASFNFAEQLNHHARVLCIDLSELRGRPQQMVGQLMIALIRETFYARDVMIPDKNYLFYSFTVDEFQEYSSDSEEALRQIFRGLRKYGIGITIANQRKSDISPTMMGTIVGTVGTLGCFQLAYDEANYFAAELGIREKSTRKKETPASVRAEYERIYHEYHGKNRPALLETLQRKMQKLEMEQQLSYDEEEGEPLGRIRPDLLQDPKLQPYHLILKGASTIIGAMHTAVPEEPVHIPRQTVFSYEDLVMHSQLTYGKKLVPPKPPDNDDEFMVTKQL
jgi:hypothetical protein